MIPNSAPPKTASEPRQKAPAGSVDTHMHMLAGASEFPLWNKRVENPAIGIDIDGFINRYKAQMATLGFSRTVVTHSILYGADNAVTLEAIRRLGVDTTRGIGLVDDQVTSAQLDALADAGVKGIRLNYVHGGVLGWDAAKSLAPALEERGMHIQMLINTNVHMLDLAPDIVKLGIPIVFDHIGWPNLSSGPAEPGFQKLCDLLADGHVYAKISGLYRLSNAPYLETDRFVGALVSANPTRCLWGSDWPYIMLADAVMPDAADLLDSFYRVVTDDEDRRKILVENPTKLYGF